MVRWRTAPLLLAFLASCSLVPADVGLPPSTENGAVTYIFLTRRNGKDEREYSNQVTGTVNSNSYLWQPWFATTQSSISVSEELTNGGPSAGNNIAVTGNAAVSLLPRSSFPTTISVARSNSRVDRTLLTADQTSNRASINQSLFLPDQWNVQSNFTYEDTSSSDFGSGDSKTASVDVDKTFESATIGLGLHHDETRFNSTTFNTKTGGLLNDKTDTINFRHTYTMFDDITVQSSTGL